MFALGYECTGVSLLTVLLSPDYPVWYVQRSHKRRAQYLRVSIKKKVVENKIKEMGWVYIIKDLTDYD